jgi:cullin-associated NEDD8-dissociated protein 1
VPPDLVNSLQLLRRAAGWRFGRHLSRAVPLVVGRWKGAGEGDDELREFALQALEAFLLRCPQDAKEHLDAIFAAVQASLAYDPNYTEDMEQDSGEEDGEEAA